MVRTVPSTRGGLKTADNNNYLWSQAAKVRAKADCVLYWKVTTSQFANPSVSTVVLPTSQNQTFTQLCKYKRGTANSQVFKSIIDSLVGN